MYKLLTTSGQSCVQTAELTDVFNFNNSPVHKPTMLYQTFIGVIHSSPHSLTHYFHLLVFAYTRYAQCLLLKLLIYLKKGY